MTQNFHLPAPQFFPPLDDTFRPAALANRAFQDELAHQGVSLVIGLERDNGHVSRFETRVFHPENSPRRRQLLLRRAPGQVLAVGARRL